MAKKKKSIFDTLKETASKAYDTVNILDSGLSWNTRKVNTNKPAKSAAQQLVGVGGNVARAVAGNTARFVNTANLGARQVANTAKMTVADLTSNPIASYNAQQQAKQDYNRFTTKGGVLNTGTFFKSPEEAARGDLKTVATRIGGGTLGTAAEVVPFARGASLVKTGDRLLPATVKGAGEGALYGAAASTGSQVMNNGNVNVRQVIEDAAKSAALGATGAAAVPAIRTARTTYQNRVPLDEVGSVRVPTKSKTTSEEFDANKYVAEQTARQEAARQSSIPAKIRTASNTFKSKFVDSYAPLEDPVKRAMKQGTKVSPDKNITIAIDRVLQSGRIAGQYIQDEGLDRIIKSVPDVNEFSQYLIAKRTLEVARKNIITGRDIAKDRQLVAALSSKYEPSSQLISQYNARLLDKSVEYGLISRETAEKFKAESPSYVPLERIFSPEEQVLQRGGKGGSVSISTSRLQQKIRGSERVIEDPLNSLLQNTQKIIEEGERANAARILASYKDLPGNPFEIKPLRTAAKVSRRMDIYKELKEGRPAIRKLERLLQSAGRQERKASVKVNRLERAGLQESLKRNISTPSKVTVSGLGGDAAMLRKAKSSKLGLNDTRKLVNDLVNSDRSKVEQLLRRRGIAEDKLAAITKEVDSLRAAVEGVRNNRAALFDEARANADALARGKATFSTFNNGIKEIYETTPEVAAAAKSLNREQLNLLGRIVSAPTRVLRLGATGVNVGFAAANVARDVVTGFINSKQSIANPAVFMQALKAAVWHGSPEYKELLREGAAGTSFDIARNQPVENVARIRAGRNAPSKIAYTVTHPGELLRAAENTVGRSEEFTRAFQYFGNKRAYINKGESQANARLLAGNEARNNTVNFARAGDYGRVLNTVLPYLNAGIQGSRIFIRNMRDRPAQTAAKVAVSTLFPMAAITAWNLSDPERRAAYEDIRDNGEYELQNNFVIIPPNPTKDKSGKWNVIKVPMSQEVANLADGVRRGVESWSTDSRFDFGRLASELIGTGTSLKTGSARELANQFVPQAVKPAVETLANQNLFFGNQIVPDAIKNLAPEDQADKGTSGTARVVGSLTGQSPLVVDNAIRTATGGVGQQLVRLSDTALAKTGVIKDEDVKGKGFIDSITSRFDSAQGSTAGGLYFKTLQDQAKKLKLSGRDYELLNALKAKETDTNGQPIMQDEKDALSNAAIRANNPRVVEVEAAAAKALAKKTGQKIDPIYNLTPEQRQTYYRIQASPYKSDDYNRLTDKAGSWLPAFQKQRSAFFDKLDSKNSTGVTATARVKYPSFNDTTQAKLDEYFGIEDPTQRVEYLKQNGDVQKAFDKINEYTNARRVAQGYDPFADYPTTSPEVEKATNTYFGLSKEGRKSFIKSNPDLYAQVQKYLADTSAWQLANNAGKAKYEGEELNQKALKAAYSLGQYSIYKDPETGVYSVDPTNAYLANYTKRYGSRKGGSGGGRRGRKSGTGKKIALRKASYGKRRGSKVKIKGGGKARTASSKIKVRIAANTRQEGSGSSTLKITRA